MSKDAPKGDATKQQDKYEYEEARALNHTADFHRMFNLPIVEHPSIPDSSRCQLRVNLLQEELDELKEAIVDQDLVEIADALCDLQYVLSGAIHEFGLTERFSDLFDAVQQSNMSKACLDLVTAERTVEVYRHKGVEAYIKAQGDVYLVYRKSDNKVLKSIDYEAVSLGDYLNVSYI